MTPQQDVPWTNNERPLASTDAKGLSLFVAVLRFYKFNRAVRILNFEK